MRRASLLQGIYAECATVLYDEIDYINEGRNADRFRRNFRDTPWVRTPVVHWEFSSPRVLTLEYLPGAVPLCGVLSMCGAAYKVFDVQGCVNGLWLRLHQFLHWEFSQPLVLTLG